MRLMDSENERSTRPKPKGKLMCHIDISGKGLDESAVCRSARQFSRNEQYLIQ